MPTQLEKLLEAKQNRLESIPGKFSDEVIKVQIQLLKDIQELLARFDIDSDGAFVISTANMELAAQLDILLLEALDKSEYAEAVTEFAKEFNTQISFNNAYFEKAFKGFETSEIGVMMVKAAQKNAVDLLTNVDNDFIIPIKQQIEQAVINGARWRETLDTIQLITTGDAETDGKILSYSKGIAHDTFAVSDRSYSAAVAEQLNAVWFKYSGGIIKTSRAFCIERHNKYFCKREYQLWGDGEKTPGFAWPQSGTWNGEMEGTNAQTIFSALGGFGCLHSAVPVSIFSVPIADVKRAVELGYYEPTEFEIAELGL